MACEEAGGVAYGDDISVKNSGSVGSRRVHTAYVVSDLPDRRRFKDFTQDDWQSCWKLSSVEIVAKAAYSVL